MQRCLLRIAVAALAFALGIGGTLLWVTLRAPGINDLTVPEQRELIPATLSRQLAQPCSTARVAVGMLQSKAISKPAPRYPPEAKAAGVSGTVNVQIVTDETGRVISAHAVSGPEMLRAAAEEAAARARFTPTVRSGQPVRVSSTISYNFVLQ